MKLKVILTGATGMVGEGVLLECLEHPKVEKVLMVNRKHCDLEHPKLAECLVPDFFKLDEFEKQLTGYDACYFCAGVSSVGMKEPEYRRLTYDLTLHFAEKVAALNPKMTFIYVSGKATDSTEKGRVMWARVKGETENALTRLPFKAVYNFRPGIMKPKPAQRNVNAYYKYFSWLYPILRALSQNMASTISEVGLAMINSVLIDYPKSILEVKDINELAKTHLMD
ncbi:MAG TPA: NAD-dependent epimerase/dehydratase family protein [Sunxiuqinia sp.]|nr:NAD-dependent epimerase/dehydratase family protein [Sunxiuqinia sp.]